jgi:hypothetical protein
VSHSPVWKAVSGEGVHSGLWPSCTYETEEIDALCSIFENETRALYDTMGVVANQKDFPDPYLTFQNFQIRILTQDNLMLNNFLFANICFKKIMQEHIR